MQMKLVLEDHLKIYFLAWCQSPVYLYQNSPDLRGYCNTPLYLFQYCGCVKFHTEYVLNTFRT